MRPPRLLIDGMNVIGSRPDRWWEDRPRAMRGLVAELEGYARDSGELVSVVFDGRAIEIGHDRDLIEVAFAPGGRDAADEEIVRRVQGDPDPGSLRVVSSDKRLAAAVRKAGAEVVPAGGFRRRLSRADQPG